MTTGRVPDAKSVRPEAIYPGHAAMVSKEITQTLLKHVSLNKLST